MENLTQLSDLAHLPLSTNQERLWIISQIDKADPTYNIQLAYHLEGNINAEVFNNSINILFERQHTLFSVFNHRDGVPYINIVPKPVIVDQIDFSESQLQFRREAILAIAGEQVRTPFDIEKGPLYRLLLIKENQQSYFFCATIHHLIFDGFSRRLFVQELSNIYSNIIAGKNEIIEPLKFHSYDFVAFEKKALSPESEIEMAAFWKENLKDCPPEIKFPYDFQRNNASPGLGCKEHFIIPNECAQKLKSFSQTVGTSLFNTLFSLVQILLNKYTGSKDICIGIPVSNRRLHHSFKTFGFFINTVPVRLIINDGNSFREHIRCSTDVVNKSVQNSQLPFEKIVDVLKPERIGGLNPFFQISFSWINNFTIAMDLAGIPGKRITVPNCISPFDITFYMWENGANIEGEIEYNINILKRETIIRLKDNYLYLLQSLAENPDKLLHSISLTPAKNQVELTENKNDSENGSLIKVTIPEVVMDLLKEMNDKNIKLYLENDKLKYKGPEQNVSTELLSKLKDNKETIIRYLQSENNSERSLGNSAVSIRNNIQSDQLRNFEQLLTYLKTNGYQFSIVNAKLSYNSPNQEQNPEVINAIFKNYRHLFHLNWPMPNANLTPIQPEGQGDPFFIVHGEQSTPFLKECFGKELPLFDYFHQSWDGSKMKYRTVEEVAEIYLQQLLSIKNEGNFFLGGYSFGGLVAYEMAQRLTQMGKKVKLLVIIDTSTPEFDRYADSFDSFGKKVKHYIVSPFWNEIRLNFWRIYCNLHLMTGKSVPPNLRSFYIVDNYNKHSAKYHPHPFNGKLHLITSKNEVSASDPYLGWKKYIHGEIEITPLSARHREIVQNPEIVKIWAKKIVEIHKGLPT